NRRHVSVDECANTIGVADFPPAAAWISEASANAGSSKRGRARPATDDAESVQPIGNRRRMVCGGPRAGNAHRRRPGGGSADQKRNLCTPGALLRFRDGWVFNCEPNYAGAGVCGRLPADAVDVLRPE